MIIGYFYTRYISSVSSNHYSYLIMLHTICTDFRFACMTTGTSLYCITIILASIRKTHTVRQFCILFTPQDLLTNCPA
ncbi:hypothetical protein SCHPADRAFT_729646 [Schizopora paradoxa]|uniref:Uncharacterized protein n=1 Tax=Schizopora paradoxa TaxID=27342 RepID=A0A0H2RKN1_9AGAM|nr:hypothetical protein SCHPADRAFT_729646 [Schizopora paradoxa]